MTDLVFAVVERDPDRLSSEIANELPSAAVEVFRDFSELREHLETQSPDGVVIDFEGTGGDVELVRWLNNSDLTCGVLLILHDLEVPGLKSLYLSGKVEVIGSQHATSDTLVRALRHSIEKRRLSRRAELANRETEQLSKALAALSEHTRGAVLILDRTGVITFVNSEAVRVFGVEEHQLLGQQFEDAVAGLKSFIAMEFGLTEPDRAEVDVWAWDGTWLGEESTFIHLVPKVPAL